MLILQKKKKKSFLMYFKIENTFKNILSHNTNLI